MNVASGLLIAFGAFGVAYFVALNGIYTVMAVIGWREVNRHVERRALRDYGFVARSPLSLPPTILVPAYNEGPVIADSVRSLLAAEYAEFEVMVINDGSSDETMAVLHREFSLVPRERVPRARLETAPVRGCYASLTEPGLVVIDKENGGKADALNAGINYAAYPLVCAIDADTILDRGALARLVWEFEAVPDTVAAGGIVRVVNGSRVEHGRLEQVRTPRSLLANLQVLEYLRAFLGGRIAWSRLGMLLIISGAFGLFRREALVEIGGYDRSTVGEDAELVLRMHRLRAERGEPCRVVFFPDPICWTEAPESLRALIGQRDRWQRGLIEMLARHRKMLGRRRYGRVGLLAVPYFALFEALGPLIEAAGYVVFAAAIAFGWVSWPLAAAIAALTFSYGLVLSFATLLMEERAFRRYPSWRDLRKLTLVAVLENFGYRQLLAFVRARSVWTLWRTRGLRSWGDMQRGGFGAGVEIERRAAEERA